MVVTDILAVEIMAHLEIVVVIHHGKMTGNIWSWVTCVTDASVEVMIVVDAIHDHVVQSNQINAIIGKDPDHRHQSNHSNT